MKSSKIRYKRNVYLIIAGVIALAAVVQLSRSQFVLESTRNTHLAENRAVAADNAQQDWLPSDPLYCVAYSSNEEESLLIGGNATKMLDYMKKQTVEIDLAAEAYQPDRCGVTIVTMQDLDEFEGLDRLMAHVEQGAYAMFAARLEQNQAFNQIYRKLGIVTSGSSGNAHGIKLVRNVLLQGENREFNDGYMVNYANNIEIDADSELLAESSEGIPLMWKRDYGQGSFLLFNGTMLQEKINRGMLAGGLSLLEPDFIYPIFNMKQMYIDDFPAPMSNAVDDNIYKEYNMNISRFFHDIWWPDMLKAAKRDDLKYTAVMIQSYNDKVDLPFDAPVDENKYSLISYGLEVIKSGGELGIHGYNHQSLQLNEEIADFYGYRAWKDTGAMASSIRQVLEYANKAFPNYEMTAYVPPSNMLDEAGREALKQAWPHLAVIASLYEEDATNRSYVQEFEVKEDGIIEMPRITSGYVDTEFEVWAETNTITSLGVFSHFVHPDDLLDDLRSQNMGWQELYDNFLLKMDRVHEQYPWLRSMTATEGAFDMAGTLAAEVRWTKGGRMLRGEIEGFQGPMYFVLRTDKSIGKLNHCSVSKIDTNAYLVKATDSSFEIGLGG